MTNEWKTIAIGSLLAEEFPGEWGEESNHEQGNALVLRSTNIDDNGKVDYRGGARRCIDRTSLAAKKLVYGDILLEASGGGPNTPVGRVAWFAQPDNETYICSNFFRTLRPIKNINSRFLFWKLLWFYTQPQIWHFQQQTTGIINLKTSEYLKTEIIIPSSVQEQQIIADILDTIDSAIQKAEQVITKQKNIRAGLLHNLLTYGLDANSEPRNPITHPEQFHQSPLGLIPKNWEIEMVGKLFNMQLGKMLSKIAKVGRKPFPYLANKNVQWDKVDLSDLEWMDFNPLEREKFRLLPNDLLVCEGGDIGRTAIWNGELEHCYFQKAIHRLRPINERTHPRYMLRYMRYAVENGYLKNLVSQTSISHLTQEKLAILPVRLPSLAEQNLIVEMLDIQDKTSEDEEITLSKFIAKKKGLMDDLLTGRIRVSEINSSVI